MNETHELTFAEEHELKTAQGNAQNGTPALIVGEFRAAISVWRYHSSKNDQHQANLWRSIANIYEDEIVRRLESITS